MWFSLGRILWWEWYAQCDLVVRMVCIMWIDLLHNILSFLVVLALIISIIEILHYWPNGFGSFYMSMNLCGENSFWLNITLLHVYRYVYLLVCLLSLCEGLSIKLYWPCCFSYTQHCLGASSTISFWKDQWFDCCVFSVIFLHLFQLTCFLNITVVELWLVDSKA